MRVAVVLFNRDLRVHDHPALATACREADAVVPLFVVDEAVLAAGPGSPNRARHLTLALADLRTALQQRGGDLVVRRGEPVIGALALAHEVGATSIHVTADVSALAQGRERRLARAAATEGLDLRLHPGVTVVPPTALRTGGGEPYKVFTPYWRAWVDTTLRPVEDAPDRVPLPAGVDPGALPDAAELAPGPVSPALGPAGEVAARARARTWIDDHLAGYDEGHDDLPGDVTSQLSPHLHLGTLSARELVAWVHGRPGGDDFARQVCWRDFHHQTTHAWPSLSRQDLVDRGRRWRDDPEALAAWQAGRTGLPIVDAGMRQLLATGWMHNRTRMITASLLTKHLGIDWRLGAAHFDRWLVDGDVANNAANWQWVAGTGRDTRPNRIFNPLRQAHRFDPRGDYVRRWVPELAGIEGGAVHEPWKVLGTFAGAGIDYPLPLLDLEEAAARFRADLP